MLFTSIYVMVEVYFLFKLFQKKIYPKFSLFEIMINEYETLSKENNNHLVWKYINEKY